MQSQTQNSSHLKELKCSCLCTQISFEVPAKPEEIAQCYCSICTGLSHRPYMSFAKYDLTLITKIKKGEIWEIRSSNRAVRGYCKTCNSAIYMLYDNSENIWIVTDLFQFECPQSETYEIYRS